MNDTRLQRETNNALTDIEDVISSLIRTIEELEKENDRKDEEINRLQDIIDKSE